MDEPNPYEAPRASIRPPRDAPASSGPRVPRRDFQWALLGAFLGVAFAIVSKLLPAEGVLWTRGGRGTQPPTLLGTVVAIALTVVGPILGGLCGRAIDRRTGRRGGAGGQVKPASHPPGDAGESVSPSVRA